MEERNEIANFTLIKNFDDTFSGELDLKNTFLNYFSEKNLNISVFGKAYDFNNNQKSYIKLKFIDYDLYVNKYGFYFGEDEQLYHDDRSPGVEDREAQFSDVPEIGFYDNYDNPGEYGEGIIYLESSKINPNSPDFHGHCTINDFRKLDFGDFTAEIDYKFEIVGWYSKKILNNDIKINLKVNYNDEENRERWSELLEKGEMQIKQFISLLAFNKDFGDIKIGDNVIHDIYFKYKLYDKILNQNLINQGYTIAEQIINQKSTEMNILEEKIGWEKNKKMDKDWENIWTKNELKQITEIEADLNPLSNHEDEDEDDLPF